MIRKSKVINKIIYDFLIDYDLEKNLYRLRFQKTSIDDRKRDYQDFFLPANGLIGEVMHNVLRDDTSGDPLNGFFVMAGVDALKSKLIKDDLMTDDQTKQT